MNQKFVKLEDIFPLMEEKLNSGAEVTFGPKGTSMLPLLVQGRDTVTIISPPERLKKYDLPLYRRSNGQFVLHRVVDILPDGTYVMCGDNQREREFGICQDDILAIVKSIKRKGKIINVNNPVYKLYTRFIVKYRKFRHFVSKTKYKITN